MELFLNKYFVSFDRIELELITIEGKKSAKSSKEITAE